MLVKDDGSGNLNHKVTTADLNWSEWLKWIWWKYQHPPQPMLRPRATWAQMLRALGLSDVEPIIRLASIDADTIPSALDVPIQRVKLKHLGHLAFILGFKSVKIDLPKREFHATGHHGSITTEDLVNFGKVIRFEGDMHAIYAMISQSGPDILKSLSQFCLSRTICGRNRISDQILRLHLFSRAVDENWENDHLTDQLNYLSEGLIVDVEGDFRIGNIHREASTVRGLLHGVIAQQRSIFMDSRHKAVRI